MNIKSNARDYFFNLHDIECNQKYNKVLPYSFHLQMVEAQAFKFQYLIPNDDYDNIFISIYGHDSIEDARLTYNDILKKYGESAAEIIYLCTEDKGRNRNERKNSMWYRELSKNRNAVFVKLCDIIANVKFSFLTNSNMFVKYKSEYQQKVRPKLYGEDYKDMFEYLEKIFSL